MGETNNHTTAKDKIKIVCLAIVRCVVIFLNNLYSIPAHLLLLAVLRPLLLKRNPKLYWTIEGLLFRWLHAMVSYWLWTAGYTVADAGDDLSGVIDDESLVIVNHQSTGDVPVLMNFMQNKTTTADHVLWVQDKIFKYTNFGWISIVHKDFFIQQGKETRHLQKELLRNHLLKYYWPLERKWIIIFPEGGFLYKRRLKSQEYARKNGYPVLEHVTLPRVGAIQTVLDTLSPQGIRQYGEQLPKDTERRPLKWLIDITIGYPDNNPLQIETIFAGYRKPCQTTLYYRKFPIEEVPLDTEKLTTWLYNLYVEKDAILETFYETGKFPSPSGTGNHVTGVVRNNGPSRVIQMDHLFLGVLHIFFLTLTWVEYRIIAQTMGLLWGIASLVC